MGVSTVGFSQDTAKAIIESPAIEEAADSLEIIIEPVIPTTEDEPVLIDISEEEIMASPEVEEVVDSVEIIKEPVEESEEEILVSPDVEEVTDTVEVEVVADTTEIMDKPGIIEEIEEEILVSPDVEEEVEPVETISKLEEQESGKVIIVSEKVGEEIDSKEKKKYDLFPDYSKKEFQSAQFLEMNDGSIILRAIMKDGSAKDTPFTKEEFSSVKNSIDKEDIQKETVEEVAEETTEEKEKPKKDKVNIVDVVYKIAGVALIIGAIILFPF